MLSGKFITLRACIMEGEIAKLTQFSNLKIKKSIEN